VLAHLADRMGGMHLLPGVELRLSAPARGRSLDHQRQELAPLAHPAGDAQVIPGLQCDRALDRDCADV